METIANIALLVAGEALCLAGLLIAFRLGFFCVGNLMWDSYASKRWSGAAVHYFGNGGFLALAVCLAALSIAFAILIPYILFGGAS